MELLSKIADPYVFSIIGILENSAFHSSVEKGMSQIISKKYQAMKVKKRVFAFF